jgi:hypothetical protein
MTETEFKKLLADAQQRFPESFRWFLGDKSRDEQKQTNRTWFECLSDCELSDCQSAVVAIQRGETEWNGKLDFLPPTIRRVAKKREADRATRQASRLPRGESIGDLSAVFREALVMRDAGAGEDAIHEFLAAKFRRGSNDLSGPRFRCLECTDTGYRAVAPLKFIEHIYGGGSAESFGPLYSAVVLCDCGRITRKENADPVFAIQNYCPLPALCTAAKAEPIVRDWLASYQTPATRGNQTLAAWNKG